MFNVDISIFMASLHQFISSIFLCILIIKCNSLSKSPLSFSCGNSVDFDYPFWQRSQKTNHLGYPNLGITCINTTPTIRLDDHLYHVKRVNKSENTFVVSFYELGDTICPIAPHDVGISSHASFLNYSNDVTMLHFFYNCTVYPSGVEPIKCLQIGAKHTYVFMEGSVPEFDWKGYCDSLVTIPVIKENVNGSLTTSFGNAMNDGFGLKWSTSLDCGSCEASGGFCEYNIEQTLSCSCSEGRNHANCRDKGSILSNFKLGDFGLLSIGLLLLCSLTIAGSVLYIMKKRRNGKRGFYQLPTEVVIKV